LVLDEDVSADLLIEKFPDELVVRREQQRGPATLIWLSRSAADGEAAGAKPARF
jgi:hypothetical protein